MIMLIIVNLLGLALIGLVAWWFWFNQPAAATGVIEHHHCH
jgi:plastocyanin domain-containing protein